MSGRTGYTAPNNGQAPVGPAQMEDIYEHFDPLVGESRANAGALPASGNWQGRTIMLEDTERVYVWTGAAWVLHSALDDTGWQAAVLTGGWLDFGSGFVSAGYRRKNGDVDIQGTVKSGATGAANPIFTLAVGYRPTADRAYVALSNVGAADLRVDTAGKVYVAAYLAGGGNGIVSLNGVRFP